MNKIVKITVMTLGVFFVNTVTLAADEKVPDVANGAKVWADTCMRCHNLRAPGGLSSRAWTYSMNHMRVRAGLTGKETRDILAFILSSKTPEDKELR